MLSTMLLSLLVWSTAASAIPARSLRRTNAGYDWSTSTSPKASSYIDFATKILDGEAGLCDMSQIVMPQAPIALPPPASGLSLSHVAVGRGTQNYTCDLSNSTAVPVAIGAVASLFNVTCMAAMTPLLLALIPEIALELPIPLSNDPTSPANMDLSGHHYFLNTTTAFFNMDTSMHSYGSGAFKKVNSSAAPAGAMTGPNFSGNGAVAWLKLNALDGAGQVFQEVYRLNTAGGNPPANCTGQQAAFEVPYAAEYWLYT